MGEDLPGGFRMGKASSLNTHTFLAPKWVENLFHGSFLKKSWMPNFSPPGVLLFLATIHYVKSLDIYNYAQSGHFENLYVSRLPVHHNVKSVNGGIHQRPHITDLGAVINTREMLAEPRVPLLPSGQETWPLGGAPMVTPPGGMPPGVPESLLPDGDESKV